MEQFWAETEATLEALGGAECLGELCNGVDRRVLRRIWKEWEGQGCYIRLLRSLYIAKEKKKKKDNGDLFCEYYCLSSAREPFYVLVCIMLYKWIGPARYGVSHSKTRVVFWTLHFAVRPLITVRFWQLAEQIAKSKTAHFFFVVVVAALG